MVTEPSILTKNIVWVICIIFSAGALVGRVSLNTIGVIHNSADIHELQIKSAMDSVVLQNVADDVADIKSYIMSWEPSSEAVAKETKVQSGQKR